MDSELPTTHMPERVHDLLQDGPWSKDLTLDRIYKTLDIYIHPDGRVLHVWENGVGVLFASVAEYNVWISRLQEKIKEWAERSKSRSDLAEILSKPLPKRHGWSPTSLLPPNFGELIPELVRQLPGELELYEAQLDGSLDSLKHIDEAVERYGQRKFLELPVFPMLVAYVGEVIRRHTNGHWEITVSSEQGIDPWIVDDTNREYDPMIVYGALDQVEPDSILFRVDLRLRYAPKRADSTLNAAQPAVITITERKSPL